MTQAQGTTGRLLADRYRLGEVLGRGGMGTVWRATDETLGRAVAVKELRFPGNVDEDEKRRLVTRTLREAKATARIRSTGAVTVYDVVEEDDRPWIVMELVESRSLSDVIREDGELTPRRAAEVGLAVLDVLRAAHREGILHRDVKPSNVLIAEDGRVVLTDFGIAQVEGDPSVTSTGMLVGAPSYISPERARGQRPGPASDLWSLGALLYAAVEGHPPYDKGSAIATLTAVMTESLEPPGKAGALSDAIYGLLRKDPEQRLKEPETRKLLNVVAHSPDGGPDDEPTVPEPTAAIALPPASERNAEESEESEEAGSAGESEEARTTERPESSEPSKKAENGAGANGSASGSDASARPVPPPVVRRPLTDSMSSKALAAIVAAVVLAVISAVIAMALVLSPGGDGRKAKSSATPKSRTSTAAGAKGSEGKDRPGGSRDGKDTPSKAGEEKENGEGDASGGQRQGPGTGSEKSSGDGTGGGSIPKGYHTLTNTQFHFSMAIPDGWKFLGVAGSGPSGVKYGPSGGLPRVQVDFSGDPKPDAADTWREADRGMTLPGYRSLSIEDVDYRGYRTAADWEFTYVRGDGVKLRVLNRGFVVDPRHAYSIMFTARASEWDSADNRKARRTFFSTFRSIG